VKLKSKTLKYSINEEWGGDAIIIGYGCEIEVFEQESIRQELDNFAIHLLTKYPNTKAYIKKTPVRAAKYLLSDKIKRKFLWDKFIHKNKENPYMDPILKVDDIWLGRTNCDICKKCNLPLQTDEMVNKYYPAI
jgi:hypothetical protein